MTLLATDFDFTLPDKLIAKYPAEKRNLSRLLYFTGKETEVQDKNFEDLVDLLPDNSVMVRNNTQVIPARCYGQRVTGAKIEILVERITSTNSCLAHVKSNRTLKNGELIIFPLEKERLTNPQLNDLLNKYTQEAEEKHFYELSVLEAEGNKKELTLAQIKYLKSSYALFISLQKENPKLTTREFQQILESKYFVMQITGRKANLFKLALVQRDENNHLINTEEAKVLTRATSSDSILELLYILGHMPLPPYMNREDAEEDEKRYQTVYAKEPGAVAAPTAGLHFTPEILEKIKHKNIDIIDVTLHVGAGTFMPLKTDIIEQHIMHAEWIDVNQHTVNILNKALKENRPIVAVGTTSVRALESIAQYSLEKYIYKLEKESLEKPITNKLYSLRIKELLLALGQTKLKLLIQDLKEHLQKIKTQNELDFNIQDLNNNLNKVEEYLHQDNFIRNTELLDNTLFYNSALFIIKTLSNSSYFETIDPNKDNNNIIQSLEIIRRKFQMIEDPLKSFSSYYMNTNLKFGKDIELLPLTSDTSIFIHPGHKVHLVDYLVTNFHLPKSTLIMLVSAFIGKDYCLSAYQHAIEKHYRFYSYGDSCFMPNIKKSDNYQYII